MTPVFQIPGLVPFVCSYTANGRRFGITLYASDPDQILRDWFWSLPGLEIDGIAVGYV